MVGVGPAGCWPSSTRDAGRPRRRARSAWPCTGSSSSGGSGARLDGFVELDLAAPRASTGCARRRRSCRSARTDRSTVALPDGRALALPGTIDRVDAGPTGGWPSSTTRPGRTPESQPDGPVRRRRPPSAAPDLRPRRADLLGAPDAEVVAEYWYLHDQHDGRKRLPVDARRADRWPAWPRSLAAIVDGIAAGLFAPHPDAPDPWRRARCAYCDPDGADTATLWGQWQHKRRDPALDGYRRLVETWTTTRPRPDAATTGPRRERRRPPRRRGRPATASPATSDPPCSCRPAPAPARPPSWSRRVVALVERGHGHRVDRRHHLHGEGGRRAAPAGPAGPARAGRRRRRRRRCGALPHRARRPRPGRPVHAARLRAAHPDRATRSRPGCPRRCRVLDEIASELDFDQRFRAFYSELMGRPELERTVVLALELGITDAAAADGGRAARRQLGPRAASRRTAARASGPRPPAARGRRPGAARGQPRARRDRQAGRLPAGAGCRAGWRRWRTWPSRGVDEVDVLDVLLHTEPPKTGSFGGGGWATTGYGSAYGARAAAKGLRRPHGRGQRPGHDVRPGDRGRPRPPRRRAGPLHAGRGGAPQPVRAADVPRPPRPLPAPRAPPAPRRAGARRAGAALPGPAAGRVPGHRPVAARASWSPSPRHRGGGAPRARAAVLRRRPQAVAVPLPSGRHRPVPADAQPSSTPTRSPSPRNFRATPPLIDWINHVFGRLITHFATDEGILAQPDFEALAAVPAPELAGPPVTVLGEEPHPKKTRIGVLREAEAAEVAATIERILARGLGGAAAGVARRVRPGAPTSPSSSRPAPRWASSRRRCGRAASPTASTPAPSSTRPTRSGRCSWPCASSTTRRTSSPWSASCARRSTAAATSTSTAGGCSGAAAGTRGRRGPSALEDDDAVWDAMADLEQRIGAARLADAQPAARLARPRPAGAGSRAGRAVTARRAGTGCASCSSRPGPGPRPGAASCGTTWSWTSRQTGLTGRVAEAVLEDGEAARTASRRRATTARRPERRRGADPDRPRLQGPGVPDHHRVRLQQPARRAAPGRAGGLRPRRRDDPAPPPGARAARVRRHPRHRRADGRARAHPPALRGLHPGPGPPRRVPPPRRRPVG